MLKQELEHAQLMQVLLHSVLPGRCLDEVDHGRQKIWQCMSPDWTQLHALQQHMRKGLLPGCSIDVAGDLPADLL